MTRARIQRGRTRCVAPLSGVASLLLLLVLVPGTAVAAPTLVQSNFGASNGNATSIMVSYTSPPTPGNLLIAFLGNRTPAGSVTRPAGWNNVIQFPGATPGASVAYKIAGAAEPLNVTYTCTTGTRLGLHIYEYSGLPSAGFRESGLNSGSGTALTSGTVTTTTNNELVITGFTTNTPTSFGSWTNSFSEQNDFQNPGSNQSTYAGADLATTIPGSYFTTATTTAAAAWFAVTVRFATVRTVSGTVFEDADFAGTASAYNATNDKALQGVDVELYDGLTDAYIMSTSTAADGSYSFSSVTDGTYKVRVRSSTLGSGGAAPKGGLNVTVPGTWPNPLPEMTWGNGAPLYGGQSATVDDTAFGNNAGPGDTYVTVSVSGADVAGVDLGFAYNLIVNTTEDSNANSARSAQGSLRQFLKNANAIGTTGGTTANSSEFRIPTSDPNYNAITGVFTITPPILLPPIADGGTALDAMTQGDNTSQTNGGNLGVGGKVGVDQLDLSTVPAPEIEIVNDETQAYGLRFTGGSGVLRGVAIHGFGLGSTGEGNVFVADAITGPLIEKNLIGSGAAAFADPGSGFRGWENVFSDGADNGTIRNNLIGFGGVRGILLSGTSINWTIEDNEIRDNSLDTTGGDGVALDPGQATVTGNLILGSSSQGVVVSGSTGSTFTNNTIQGNGIGTDAASDPAAGMTFRPTASGHMVDRNEFIANYGAGLSVNNGSTGIKITQNSFLNNGTIEDRRMVSKSDQIGIDLNNPTDNSNIGNPPYVSLNDPGDTPSGGNNQLNYPVLDTALINGSNLELTGWAPANSVIEIFVRDTDPSLFGEGLTHKITLTDDGTGTGGGSGEDPYPDADTGPATMYTNPVNGINQGTDTTNRFSFTFPTPAAIAAGVELTATARDASNNTSEFGGRVVVAQAPADLTLTKTDAPDPAPLDGSLVYTLVVTNNGPGTATGVTVTDTLPASVTLISATPSQGSCPGTDPVSCSLGAILNSGTASIEILVTTSATGTITNNASVTLNETDPVPADNAVSEDTDVVVSGTSDVPLTQFDRIHGFIDYTVTGGSLRTQPNAVDPCAVAATSSGSIAGIPGSATIRAAYLYWGGSGTTVDNTVTFDGTSVTADRTFVGQFTLGATTYDFFGGFEDVTAKVAAKGNGSYGFQDLTVDTGNPFCSVRAVFAGWTLVVVYDDTSLTGKTLVLYDGFDIERNGSTSYLLTGIFAADPPEAKTSFLVWEGDPDLGGTNEKLEFNGTAQSDGLNPVNNMYNSTINSLPSSTEWGLDVDTFDVSSEVAAADTLATVGLFTGPDLVILNAVVLQVKSNIIVGKVFEDVNYGGAVGRNRATSAASAPSFTIDRPTATVELYDAAGNFLRTTATNASGQYGFAGLVDGDYQVRVVNETVDSSRPDATGAEWPVQTYRTNASTGTAAPVIGEVGGASPQLQDAGPNAAMANLSGFTAQSVAPAKITTGVAVTDVDFGYNFDTIVNTNDAGQGSLRQFILNSNALTNANLDQEDVAAVTKNPGDEHSIFMIPASELAAAIDGGGGTAVLIQPATGLDPITDANTALDGRTQTVHTGDTNSAVAEVTTGPEVIIDLQGAVAADVLTVRSDDTIVDSLGLTGAAGLSRDGIDAGSLDGAQFRNNTVFANGAVGVYLNSVTGSTVSNNVLRNNGVAETVADGVVLTNDSTGNTISGNEIVDNAAFGIDLTSTGNNSNNTITGNLIKGNGTSASDQDAGIKIDSSDNSSVTLNTITENAGDGIVITSGDTGNLISQNSIFNNGALGVDLSLDSSNDGDGVTLNDDPEMPGGGNSRQNFPEITSATWNGINTVVKGRLVSTLAATFDIEIFSSGVCNGAVNGSPQVDAYGEGETYRTTANVTDGDSDGIVTFSANVPVNLTGQQVTATATDTSSNNTSEFSACYGAASLSIVKRAFQVDGTSIASGSSLPTGMPVKFMLYIDNPGGAISDISLQDVLDPLFAYQPESMKIDNTLVSTVVCPGGVCDESAIFVQVNGSGTPLGDGDAVTAPIDADAGSYDSGSKTLRLGDGTNTNNAQLDLAADRVWAMTFTVTIQ